MLKLLTAFAATHASLVWGLRVDMNAEKTKGDIETSTQAVFVSDATKTDAIGVFDDRSTKSDVIGGFDDRSTKYDAIGVSDVANKEDGEAVSGEVRPYPKHIIFHAFFTTISLR